MHSKLLQQEPEWEDSGRDSLWDVSGVGGAWEYGSVKGTDQRGEGELSVVKLVPLSFIPTWGHFDQGPPGPNWPPTKMVGIYKHHGMDHKRHTVCFMAILESPFIVKNHHTSQPSIDGGISKNPISNPIQSNPIQIPSIQWSIPIMHKLKKTPSAQDRRFSRPNQWKGNHSKKEDICTEKRKDQWPSKLCDQQQTDLLSFKP